MDANTLQTLITLLSGNTVTPSQKTQPQFDFAAYNAIMQNSSGGLKIYLAVQNLDNIASMLVKIKSPLATEAREIVELLTDFRTKYQQAAKLRQQQGPATSNIPQGEQRISQEQYEQFQRFLAFQKEGKPVSAEQVATDIDNKGSEIL